jgi:hypothetical protein
MSRHRNPNYEPFRKCVESMGGRVTDFRPGRKHFIAYITTARGLTMRMALSMSPMADGAIEFYTRRSIKREERRHASARADGNLPGYQQLRGKSQ